MKKLHSKQSKFKKFISGKGFYAALAVCLVGAGMAAWVGVDKTLDRIHENNNAVLQEQKKTEQGAEGSPLEQVAQTVSDVPQPSTSQEGASNSASSSPKSAEQESLSQEPAQDALSQNQLYILPTVGEIMTEYSKGELVKNITLNVWRTHDGIDIKSPKGTPVKAVHEGTVKKIYEDPLWGVTIEVEHEDGLQSIYCGLDKDVKVKQEDAVAMGDIIGSIGEIPAESVEQEHLHFAMKRDGSFINPMDLIQNGQPEQG